MRLDNAAMKHRTMGNADIVLQNQREFIFHDVHNGSVLDICVFTDANIMHITADDAVEPNAGVIANFDIADNLGTLGNEDAFPQFWPLSLVFMQHPRPPGKETTLTERGQIIQERYRFGGRFSH